MRSSSRPCTSSGPGLELEREAAAGTARRRPAPVPCRCRSSRASCRTPARSRAPPTTSSAPTSPGAVARRARRHVRAARRCWRSSRPAAASASPSGRSSARHRRPRATPASSSSPRAPATSRRRCSRGSPGPVSRSSPQRCLGRLRDPGVAVLRARRGRRGHGRGFGDDAGPPCATCSTGRRRERPRPGRGGSHRPGASPPAGGARRSGREDLGRIDAELARGRHPTRSTASLLPSPGRPRPRTHDDHATPADPAGTGTTTVRPRAD